MLRTILASLVVVAGAATLVASAFAAPQASGYHLVKKVTLGGEGGWDYLNVDSDTHRVFVSHGTHVMVVDPDGNVVGDIPNLERHARSRAGARNSITASPATANRIPRPCSI